MNADGVPITGRLEGFEVVPGWTGNLPGTEKLRKTEVTEPENLSSCLSP